MSKSTIYSRYFTYIKPVTKLPVIKNYGSIIFTLLSLSVLVIFAIRPTVETIIVLQKKLADEDQVLQKITQKSTDLSQGKKNYDNLDFSIKEKISTAVPDTISIKSLVQTLEQTAKMHDASVSALQIQPLTIDTKEENQMGVLDEIAFTFNVEGDYIKLIALLQDLKQSSRLLSIDTLSIGKSSDDKGLIMSLSGKAYYFK